MITITAAHIEQLRTPAGGFNKATMDELAVMWPLRTGWQQELIGKMVGDRKWQRAVKAAARGPRHFFRGNTRRAS